MEGKIQSWLLRFSGKTEFTSDSLAEKLFFNSDCVTVQNVTKQFAGEIVVIIKSLSVPHDLKYLNMI